MKSNSNWKKVGYIWQWKNGPEPWFAWHPVSMNDTNKIVWLETVLREKKDGDGYGDYWVYTTPNESLI